MEFMDESLSTTMSMMLKPAVFTFPRMTLYMSDSAPADVPSHVWPRPLFVLCSNHAIDPLE